MGFACICTPFAPRLVDRLSYLSRTVYAIEQSRKSPPSPQKHQQNQRNHRLYLKSRQQGSAPYKSCSRYSQPPWWLIHLVGGAKGHHKALDCSPASSKASGEIQGWRGIPILSVSLFRDSPKDDASCVLTGQHNFTPSFHEGEE